MIHLWNSKWKTSIHASNNDRNVILTINRLQGIYFEGHNMEQLLNVLSIQKKIQPGNFLFTPYICYC